MSMAAHIAKYLGYELVIIAIGDATGENLINIGIGGSKFYLIEKGTSSPVTKGIMGMVFSTGSSQFLSNTSQDPAYCSIPSWIAGSEICLPMRDGDRIIGVINLERSEIGKISVEDKILLESLASILTSMILNARRYQQLQNMINQLSGVRETALDIIANLELDTLFQRVVHRTRELVQAKGAELGLVDEDRNGIRVQTSENPWYDFSGHLIPKSQGIAGQVLATGESFRISDYNSWSQRLMLDNPAPFKAAAGVPLKIKGAVIGTLVVMDDQPERTFSDEDVALMELIAPIMAISIHNAKLYQQIQELVEVQRLAENRMIRTEKLATAGRLTASIAHEINNPLQSLNNCLYLAERNELSSEERNRYLHLARSELDHLVITVQRILDFYRPGVRSRSATDVNILITQVVALLQPQLNSRRIITQMQLDQELPHVTVVASQIHQVLLNLIINSMDAMPNGGVLSIDTAPWMSDQRQKSMNRRMYGIEITIRDTGPGIPSEEIEHLYEPMESRKENGTGLGLAVSYGIIQAHGGSIKYVGKRGHGACFKVNLLEDQDNEIKNNGD